MFWTLRRILLLIMVISTITVFGTLIWVGITYQRFAIDTMQDVTGKMVSFVVKQRVATQHSKKIFPYINQWTRSTSFIDGIKEMNLGKVEGAANQVMHSVEVAYKTFNLHNIIIYTKEMELFAKANKYLPESLVDAPDIMKRLKKRTLREKRNVSAYLWRTKTGLPVYSIVAPIGGFGAYGFIEFITNPIPELIGLGEEFSGTFRLMNLDGDILLEDKDSKPVKGDEKLETLWVNISGTDGKPWSVVSLTRDTSAFKNEIDNRRTDAIVIISVVILVSVFIGWLLLRLAVFSRIKGFASAMDTLAKGDTNVTLPLTGSDEFGTMRGALEGLRSAVQMRDVLREELAVRNKAKSDYLNKELDKALKHKMALIALQQELEIAKDLQQAILPENFPNLESFSVFGVMQAAKEVGGDFYDCFFLDEDRYALVMADVSGKGVPAALFMAISRTLLKATALAGLPVSDCLARVNSLLCEGNEKEMFVTLFYGILNIKSGKFTYANGGHNTPYLINASGEVSPFELTGDMALAVMEDIPYSEQSITLSPGDSVFMFTDGITESINTDSEEYGEERLEDCLANIQNLSTQAIAVKVMNAVEKFSVSMPQFDDMTCLILRYVNDESHLHPQEEASHKMTISLKNDLVEIARLTESVEVFGEECQLPMEIVFNVNLVLDELITNIFSYGYEDTAEHQVTVSLCLDENELTGKVTDDAKPFNPLVEVKEPDLDAAIEDRAIGGLGVHFLKTFMDDVHYTYEEGQNKLVFTKNIEVEASPSE